MTVQPVDKNVVCGTNTPESFECSTKGAEMVMSAAKAKTSSHSQTYTPICEGKFSVGSRTCEVYRFHTPGEGPIDTVTLIARGKNIMGLNMDLKDGKDLLKYRDQIPDKYKDNIFLFPLWDVDNTEKKDGCIRVMNKTGTAWWCVTIYPDVREWDTSCRIIRFTGLQLTA